MKKCASCDFENADDALQCESCSTNTFISFSPAAFGGHNISPKENRFWQRMNFRQFAVVFVRFQAVFFLFNAVYNVTYLLDFWGDLKNIFDGSEGYAADRHRFFLEIIRTVMNFAAAVVCLQFAERIVSWLVKDMVPKTPPQKSDGKQPSDSVRDED